MQLILVRHGQAVSAQSAGGDAFRWLTTQGRFEVEGSARLMPEQNFTAIVSSPLVRAVQTAERLASICGYTREIQIHRPLSGGTTGAVLAAVEHAEETETIALVGHEPVMSSVASHLLGRRFPGFPTAGILKCTYMPNMGATFTWFVDPRGHCVHALREVRPF